MTLDLPRSITLAPPAHGLTKAAAIVALVGGALAFGMGAWGLAELVNDETKDISAFSRGSEIAGIATFMRWETIHAVLSLLLGGVLIWGGLGVARHRPAGRPAILGAAVAALVVTAVHATMLFVFLFPAFQQLVRANPMFQAELTAAYLHWLPVVAIWFGLAIFLVVALGRRPGGAGAAAHPGR